MRIIEGGERFLFPTNPDYVRRRCEELESICCGIILRLPPEEQAFFREYRELLQIQEEVNIRCAYYGGIRIGKKQEK